MSAQEHNPGAFLDLPPEFADRRKARVLVLPVPYEATTTWVKGTARGPAAIIEASRHAETYDEIACDEPFRAGIHTLPPLEVGGEPAAALEEIRRAVAGLASEGKFILSLGGEHALTIGAVRGIADVDDNLTVVQLDAHSDLRDEYEGSPFNHACVMRRLFEDFPIVQIGIRSLTAEDARLIEERGIPVFFADAIASTCSAGPREAHDWMNRAIEAIPTRRVYLTFDIDAFDPSIMPAVGTPEPGGLLWYEVLTFLRILFERRDVVAADIVELCPIEGMVAPDFLAARLAYAIAGHALRA
jgi:agmatinase